jgi:hypothetical protein
MYYNYGIILEFREKGRGAICKSTGSYLVLLGKEG